MRRIGAHVSIAGGVQTAPGRAQEIGATALGIFTKNQRQWQAKPLSEEEVGQFKIGLAEAAIAPKHVLVHASYLINVANPDPDKRAKSIAALVDDAQRVEQLGLTLLNFHPGSGLGEIEERETITAIADGVKQTLAESETAVLVLEITAGQGAHVGYKFEHLASIIEQAGSPERVAACIDTCHAYAAGYDLREQVGFEAMVEEFDSTVGLSRLAGIHLNDSKSALGSRVDRHDSIGLGELGIPALARVVADNRFDELPIVLETPQPAAWGAEIALLVGLADGTVDPATAKPPVRETSE